MEENKAMQTSDKKELDNIAEGTHSGRYFEPLVDIFEADEKLTLLADMPGVSENDVDIDLRDGVLTVLGKIPERAQLGEAEHLEFEYGNYLRRFTLTDRINQEGISASMKNGVLRIELPKEEKAKPRKINVTLD